MTIKRTPLREESDAVPATTPYQLDWSHPDLQEPVPELERLARAVARIVDRSRATRESRNTTGEES